MDNNNPKQLIVDRIKQATNILVTVENNPSVDELAAALALTLILNKLDKHATAVFSGAVPPAITFLQPDKTFEHTVDSLRDFIIALDKEKADRLRYKVEDDMVKIFITPYRSTITSKDLEFSEGDFNVEVVVALGVEKRESLDRAIAAHGRILHDATVITINARDERSSLGVIDWQDGKASSICEMLVGLGEALEPKVLDAQISTALLTGIVAATDRFSNKGTTPHIMTLAAELMAAGANQQLIANSLSQAAVKAEPKSEEGEGRIERAPEEAPKDEGPLSESSQKVEKAAPEKPVAPPPTPPPADGSKGEMKVRHDEAPEEEQKPAEAPAPPVPPAPASPPAQDTAAASVPTVSDELSDLRDAITTAADKPFTSPPPALPAPASQPMLPPAPAPAARPADEPKIIPLGKRLDESGARPNWQQLEPPTLGGTLNATSAEAEEERRREAEEEQRHNNVTLTHGDFLPSEKPNEAGLPTEFSIPSATPQSAAPSFPQAPLPPMPGAATAPPAPAQLAAMPPMPAQPAPAAAPAVDPAAQQDVDLEAARRAVSDALSDEPFMPSTPGQAPPAPAPALPAEQPLPPLQSSPAPAPSVAPAGGTLPPLPDFSTLPPLPPLPGAAPTNPMQSPTLPPGTDITAQLANPGVGTSGTPLPPTQQAPAPPAPGQFATDPNDPNQFRIPGQ
ncbi:MAG TPA: hypothetical protein VLF60_03845 [Candidatus Saccharimonadales bacterium]|nr:hypothetical protein [Candidatus Saccharimonadales bacterium]